MASHATRALLNCYKQSFPVIVPFTTTLGLGVGLGEIICEKEKTSALFNFSTIIAYTTLGLGIGVTSPVTFPLIALDHFWH